METRGLQLPEQQEAGLVDQPSNPQGTCGRKQAPYLMHTHGQCELGVMSYAISRRGQLGHELHLQDGIGTGLSDRSDTATSDDQPRSHTTKHSIHLKHSGIRP